MILWIFVGCEVFEELLVYLLWAAQIGSEHLSLFIMKSVDPLSKIAFKDWFPDPIVIMP